MIISGILRILGDVSFNEELSGSAKFAATRATQSTAKKIKLKLFSGDFQNR